MEYQSQIRQSTLNQLLEKAERLNYGKYLPKVRMVKLRSFTNQTVNFEFPVTALIGPNGGGKTTILGACACAYSDMRPRKFFAKSSQFDEAMQDWSIEYELVDRSQNQRDIIRRTAKFTRLKWTRDAINRQVLHFGVERTLPAVEKAELLRFTNRAYHATEENIIPISGEMAYAVQHILNRNIDSYSMIKMRNNGEIDLLTGITNDNRKYSEFHFGAGESSIIKMVAKIEQASMNSLILIEEIENGLHPVATQRLVEYLIDVADRKNAQIVFTTHSDDALLPLPDKAIWSAIDGTVFQGKLSISSLRSITGQVESRLIIYTEDVFAQEWVQSIITRDESIAFDTVSVYPMAGDGTAVKINKHHNEDPAARCTPSICMIDGDSSQKDSVEQKIFRLPGECPEMYVFDKVLDKIDEISPYLTISLGRKYEEADRIKSIVIESRRIVRDPHLLYSSVGKRLGFLSEQFVRRAFMSTWCVLYEEEVRTIIQRIGDYLPRNR